MTTTATANFDATMTSSVTAPASSGDNDTTLLLKEYAARRSGKGSASSPSLAELKAKLAHAHTPLVESIARRFVGSGEPFDDLVQEGFLGLLSALDNYDPDRTASTTGKKIKFSTYATHFVAGAIRHFLRDRGKIIKEPAWLHEVSVKVLRSTDTLTVQLGRTPTTAEIAQSLNLTEEAVEEILSTRQTFQVAAFGSSTEESDSTVGLVDPEKIRSDKYVTLRLPIEDRIVLENAVLKLKEMEQRVLFEFFYQDHTQTEIAKQCGISCNYVSHILKNATQKLRRIMGEAEVRDRARASRIGDGDAGAALTCSTTGLHTASQMLRRAEEMLSRSARENRSCALIYLSIEGMPERGLKRETLLHEIGAALRGIARRFDLVGRADAPDDFVLLLPQKTAEQANALAAELQNRLMATGAAEGEQLVVRASSAVYPAAGRTLSDLLAVARQNAGISAPTHSLADFATSTVRNNPLAANLIG